MTGTRIDLATWAKADQFRFFGGFERPHFNTTARVDVTALMAAKSREGLSPFRAALWAFGAAHHKVDALRLRFRGDEVTLYDRVELSPTIAIENGDFRYTYLTWDPDRAAFDAEAKAKIDGVRAGQPLNANSSSGQQDVAYFSCMPWLDYTALDNAMPDAADCIPRVGWGKIVPKGAGFDMAVTLCVHHALVDGRGVGLWFEAVQDTFASL